MTFAWNVSNTLSGTNQTLNILLNNVSNYSNVGSSLYADSTNKVLVYYRVEDATNSSTLGTTDISFSSISTYWINANETSTNFTTNSGQVTANNYYIVPSTKLPYYSSPIITNSSNNVHLAVTLPYLLSTNLSCVSNGNTYIYIRVGLPMASTNYSITSCQTYLST